jgi:hypothetical protein
MDANQLIQTGYEREFTLMNLYVGLRTLLRGFFISAPEEIRAGLLGDRREVETL